jgi:archaellum component FlaC
LIHQGIQLSEEISDATLYTDLVTPDTVYFCSMKRVFQVQLGLYRYLNDLTTKPELASDSDAVARQLLDLGSSTISGLAIISDMTLGLSYFCLSPTTGITADALFPIIPPPLIPTTTQSPYQSDLKPFNYELLNNIAKSATLSTKSEEYPHFVNEKSIPSITQQIETSREKIQDILHAFADLKDRMGVLTAENKVQTTALQTSDTKIEGLKQKTKDCVDRLKKIKETQDKQTKRVSSLLEMLFDMTQPRLSAQEIQWFQELSQLLNVYQTKYVPTLRQVLSFHLDGSRIEIIGDSNHRR